MADWTEQYKLKGDDFVIKNVEMSMFHVHGKGIIANNVLQKL